MGFSAMYKEHIPIVYLFILIRVKPFFSRINIISFPCGKAAMDAGKYL
jgi:hypothetical protein